MNRKSAGILSVGLTLALACSQVFAQTAPPQTPAPVAQPSEPQMLSPDALDNLVAPIALYPDPLLGQVLAASTYPLEIVEAQQWLQQNSNLHGQQLMDAARQQNWDPSIQALVAFPDVMTMLNRDVQWTTDLGNAFLAQQKDVMAAIQRMRRRAQQNGKLTSTAQETVNTVDQDGQSAVQIEPANPQVVYVPVYNPVYVWGPPMWGYYPPLWYPGIGFGFGWGPGIYLGAFFPGWGIGWGGWGLGWGWGCGWFGGGLFVNNGFFNHYGFNRGYFGGAFPGGGREAWMHDSFHRQGVGYGNANVAARYNNARFAAGRYNAGGSFNGARSSATAGGWQRFGGNSNARGSNGSAARGASPAYRGGASGSSRGYSGGNYGRSSSSPSYNRGAAGSYGRSYSAPSSRGYSGGSYGRSYSAPSSRGYSGGGSSRGSSAPRSGGFSGGGHSGGGGHGGRR